MGEGKGWCWKCKAYQSASNELCAECGASRPVRGKDPWTWQGAIFVTILVGVVAGFGFAIYSLGFTSSPANAEPPFFELLEIMGESRSAVEASLGEAVAVVPITNVPANMPGEFRDYEIPGITEVVSVRFFRNSAVFVTVILPHGEDSAEDALSRVGIDLRGVPASTTAPGAVWWRSGRIQGHLFEKIGALRGMNGTSDLFDMVQAELRYAP